MDGKQGRKNCLTGQRWKLFSVFMVKAGSLDRRKAHRISGRSGTETTPKTNKQTNKITSWHLIIGDIPGPGQQRVAEQVRVGSQSIKMWCHFQMQNPFLLSEKDPHHIWYTQCKSYLILLELSEQIDLYISFLRDLQLLFFQEFQHDIWRNGSPSLC